MATEKDPKQREAEVEDVLGKRRVFERVCYGLIYCPILGI